MEKYPFYDIVLFIAILSNVLFMSIAIIIIRTKKTSRKNSQLFHIFIKKLIADGKDIVAVVDEISEKNHDITIISTEIGYGVVPMDKGDREWRETVGRTCCYIAKKADEVVRVVCGVGNRIK